jgi:hypothetical protein
MILAIFAYLAVFLQVAFPFLMLNSVTRRLALPAIMGMHVGIGILLALPFFSLIMITTDMLFIRDASYRRSACILRELWKRRQSDGSSAEPPPTVAEASFPPTPRGRRDKPRAPARVANG